MRVLDLFAGAGGFSLGFKLAGFQIVGAIEKDNWAAETFVTNFQDSKVIIGDIQELGDRELLDTFRGDRPDIIIGGPPCQGFSICQKKPGDPKDPRNSLFREFLRVAQIFEPEYLILENVPQLAKARTHSNEWVIEIIENEFKKLGYYVYRDILSSVNYGIPQIRRRLFIIAAKKILKVPFPPGTHYYLQDHLQDHEQLDIFQVNLEPCPTLWEAISDLPEIEAREGAEEMNYFQEPSSQYQKQMRQGSQRVYNHVAMKHSKRTVARFSTMSWGDSLADVPEYLKPYKRNGKGMISQKVYDQNSRRLHPHRPCHTIPASFYANFVHPYKHRNFTAREGARIQSFPDWFIFKGKPTVVSQKLLEREGRFQEKHLCQYNQIGNAVPPLLAQAIALNLLNN